VTVLTVAATVVIAGGGVIAALWLAARPSRNGTLAQAWGQLDDDEAKEEIESVFPGATKPVEPPGESA
jgi:hypothetical protein